MSKYESQAEQFLQDHGIKFSTWFLGHGPHFGDETETRDRFSCIFRRAGPKRLAIKFGQSLNDSDGVGGNPPHPYCVLSGITKYDPGSFEDFCSEFGYDVDSRKAERTYKLVCDEWRRVEAFFTAEELEKARGIQ